MWKRCRYWFLLIALIGIALAVYFEPTRCVRGWLWGEAFFDGRPTSYWRDLVQRDLHRKPTELFNELSAMPAATWWEKAITRLGLSKKQRYSRDLITFDRMLYPHFGEPAQDAVLGELSQDQDERIAAFAADASKMRAWTPRDLYWIELVRKHNIRQAQ